MKSTIYLILVVMMVLSCSKQSETQVYDNLEIGLKITYSGSWQVINDSALDEALISAEKHMTMSQEAIGFARDFIPLTLLRLAKPRQVNGIASNSIINVVATPIRKDEWGNLDRLIQDQTTLIRVNFPDVMIIANAFPLPEYPSIHNFLAILPEEKRIFSQYQYAYWSPPYLIQIAFSFSHSDDEQELKKIIASMKIEI
ncbi:hypothetical protein FM038_022190 [Shewanella eurypsychrophilus]|uniref:Lipoprotein n=1 Tax=Shewanella eurypsychrophilus TaxID=2593656 RepID=A0ABX6VD17_9GAMM|nr:MULTISPECIES: hypothetical protein [Shewanella]QFU24579.1 hypothetical protein FS418_23865 [Shewanella sp. YLB-09]QPG59776.1 hypothetical protein FM038_022190 [Shewanella eurypsychrophilus]